MAGNSIKSIVRKQSVNVPADSTVDDAITAVREFTPTNDGVSVYYVYITENGQLAGVVSMRELLNAEDTAPVSTIMTTDVIMVTTNDSVQSAARKIIDNRFPALPVVDRDGRFDGVVRATDLIDALDEATTKTLFKQAGLWMR